MTPLCRAEPSSLGGLGSMDSRIREEEEGEDQEVAWAGYHEVLVALGRESVAGGEAGT